MLHSIIRENPEIMQQIYRNRGGETYVKRMLNPGMATSSTVESCSGLSFTVEMVMQMIM